MDAAEIEKKLNNGNAKWAEFIELAQNLQTFFTLVREFKADEETQIVPVALENFFDQNIKPFAHLFGDETKAIGNDYFEAFLKAKKLAKLL